MGYDPDDSYPDDICYRCGAEGPYYLFNQAQEYGWGGGAQTMECLRQLREEREDVIEHLFQYIVQRLKSKINFSGIVASFEVLSVGMGSAAAGHNTGIRHCGCTVVLL